MKDWNCDSELKNGFLFMHYSYNDFLNAIQRALAVFANKTEYDSYLIR